MWVDPDDVTGGGGTTWDVLAQALIIPRLRRRLIELGRWIAEQIPDARLECIDDAGHSPQYESPERFTALVSDFAAGG